MLLFWGNWFMDQRAKKTNGAAIFALVAYFALAGCGSNRPAVEPGTVNFLIEASPTNLDPRIGTDAQSEDLDGLIFENLLARDARMNVVPGLAERWETPDPLTYIFHLRSGRKFHDGRALTSADVKFTYESILSGAVKSPKRGTYEIVQSIDTPDDATVVFHLREPYASFLWNLTSPGMGIVPRGSSAEVAQHPIGTGPFRFVSAEQDEEIVLERNPDYFRGNDSASGTSADFSRYVLASAHLGAGGEAENSGRGNIQRVRFRIVPDAVVRALELRKGTADLGGVNSQAPDTVVTLAKEPGIVAEEQPGTQLAYIAFNFTDPILAHREVRQAFAYATDRASLIRYLLRGQAQPASSLLPPNHWAYEPNVRQYPYDPSRAEQLLDAGGFPRGKDGVRFHIELKTSTDESTRLLGEALADEWKRVGVVLDLRPLEFATFYSDVTHGSFQLYIFRWVGGNNDPDFFDYVFNSKKVPPFGANRGKYNNPILDALLEQQKMELDRAKRKAILAQIQRIVAEDEPYVDLWYPDNVCVHRDRVADIVISPAGDYNFLSAARVK
jgi:peptide/nickel transport system substrate-binding protein